MKTKLINTLDIENYNIEKIQEQIMDVARKNYEEQILTTTNSIKKEILNFEDIENAIKLLEKNKTQVILLNYNIRGRFEKMVLGDDMNIKQELHNLMGILVILYPYEKFNFYFHGALKKYDEIIWIPKEGEIYIIDSKKFLEFINNYETKTPRYT